MNHLTKEQWNALGLISDRYETYMVSSGRGSFHMKNSIPRLMYDPKTGHPWSAFTVGWFPTQADALVVLTKIRLLTQ